MAIKGLTIIGESINDSVPSTNKKFENNDIDGILRLAESQDKKGASYIDVNIGKREPGFMADLIKKIQGVTSKPLSIDTPDPEIAAAGLEAYDPAIAHHKMPILNSIAPARSEMFDLYAVQPFLPVLLLTERLDENGEARMNLTAEQTHASAKIMMDLAKSRINDLSCKKCILDPGIMPIGSDTQGHFKRLIGALKLIQKDDELSGVNISVGLSNFTIMLPSRRPDGSPVKSALESAFLTIAMPLGLNMIIGSVKRKYRILPEDHPAMQCIREVLDLEGMDVVTRVMMFTHY